MLASFNWIILGQLAGSGRPGLLAEVEEDLAFVREQGIRTIVSLTIAPLDALAGHEELELIHFPIPDMSFPTPRACASSCEKILANMREAPVLLHCRAGLGRTGTVAACCLVSMGTPPEEALTRVRGINPNYVQTRPQERFIHHYAEYLRRN